MAIQDQQRRRAARCSSTRSPTARSGPDIEMPGPVADGGHIVWNSTPGLLGPDDHAGDPRRARGLHAGRGRGRRGRRRDRDPDQGHRGHLDGDVLGQRPGDGGPLQRRPVLRARCAPAAGRSGRRRGSRGSARPRCAARPAAPTATPFTFTNGYTVAFDDQRRLGLTVDEARAEELARDAARAAALPDNSIQNPILTFAPHDIVGLVTRMRPFLGQLGTSPSATIPDSHNAGDFGAFLVGAPHAFAMDATELQQHKTDGHLDIDAVRAGAILVCPVKLAGRRRLPRRHARDAGRRRDRRPHRRRRRHGDAAGRGRQGARDRRAGAVPAARGPAVPGQAADRRTSARTRWRSPSARA